MPLVTFVIGPNPPPRLDKALARDVPEDADLSRSRLVRLLAEGAVQVAGEVVRDPKARVAEGDAVVVTVALVRPDALFGQAIPLDVVYEDADLIVVNKPPGMVVHPAPGSPDGTLVNALIAHCGDSLLGVGGERRPGIVHRIDKDTSGLLVAAKTDRAHHGLSDQFAAHTVERHYMALCHGMPDAADPRLRGIRGVAFEPGGVLRIATGIDRHRTDRQRQAVVFGGGRAAVTRVRVDQGFGDPPGAALVDCWLETGRTHQIRVHLAHAGHALIGDPVYGGRRQVPARMPGAAAANGFARQALHAATLGFVHPVTGVQMRFAAPSSPDLAALLANLRSHT